MFYNADSGLDLATYRAYNPAIGRWLSRDPIGEGTDPTANLYAYVGGNPISLQDSLGLDGGMSYSFINPGSGAGSDCDNGAKPTVFLGESSGESGERLMRR
jgi:RHS repeat-associated protein